LKLIILLKKVDIYVQITKLLTDQVVISPEDDYIFYETNTTNIPLKKKNMTYIVDSKAEKKVHY
jgi:hypothetical protein